MSSSPQAAAPPSGSLKRKSPDEPGSPQASSTPTKTPDAKKPKVNASITSFFGAPKVTPAKPLPSGSAAKKTPEPDAVVPPFDKDEWVKSLPEETRSLLALEINTLDPSWLAVLKGHVVSPEFLALKRFLAAEVTAGKKVFPPSGDVYSWSRHTPLHKVKAVILGQDPYHNVNQAHGLCFSVRPPTPAPPSLANMFKLLAKEYPEGCKEGAFVPPPDRGGLLTPWADRGVLLLNTCLTVRAHEANSHAGKGWEAFTQKVIDTVARQSRGVVFLAWGRPAQQRTSAIKKNPRHLVLESVHPSPLSAARGFFDCGHFHKTNKWLRERYGDETGPIDWRLDVEPDEARL